MDRREDWQRTLSSRNSGERERGGGEERGKRDRERRKERRKERRAKYVPLSPLCCFESDHSRFDSDNKFNEPSEGTIMRQREKEREKRERGGRKGEPITILQPTA
jgi:hypothetical protein